MVRLAPGSNTEIGKVLEINGDYKKVKYDTRSRLLLKEGQVTRKYVKNDEEIK